MLKRLVVSLALVSAGFTVAAVKPGGNLLINGAFEAEQLEFPMFWEKGGQQTRFDPTGGPGNTGAVVFSNPEGAVGVRSTCRQHDLQLVPHETYKISAYVKDAQPPSFCKVAKVTKLETVTPLGDAVTEYDVLFFGTNQDIRIHFLPQSSTAHVLLNGKIFGKLKASFRYDSRDRIILYTDGVNPMPLKIDLKAKSLYFKWKDGAKTVTENMAWVTPVSN